MDSPVAPVASRHIQRASKAHTQQRFLILSITELADDRQPAYISSQYLADRRPIDPSVNCQKRGSRYRFSWPAVDMVRSASYGFLRTSFGPVCTRFLFVQQTKTQKEQHRKLPTFPFSQWAEAKPSRVIFCASMGLVSCGYTNIYIRFLYMCLCIYVRTQLPGCCCWTRNYRSKISPWVTVSPLGHWKKIPSKR